VRCECGCGFDGVDEVAQLCVEEAALTYWAVKESREASVSEHGGSETAARHAELMAQATGGQQ
jgi:hypothetical protein